MRRPWFAAADRPPIFPLLALALALVFFVPGSLEAQVRVVTGTVIDAATGNAIPFAQVGIPGTATGTTTDADGRFRLEGVPAGAVTLRVQNLGYRTREVVVAAGEDTVRIELATDYLNVEEIVVTGRATTVQRRNAANAVATLSAQEIQRVPSQTVEKQIQGKVAGADIQKNSGAPGGGVQVNLRGVSSINASSQPLYVVDGIIVSNVAIPNGQDIVTGASAGSNPSTLQQDQVNRISDINPQDIERIEILKGPSASAIYGSKASNGVVLITTKKGRPGATRIDVTQWFGVFALSNTLDYRTFQDASVEEVVEIFGEAAREPFLEGRVFDHEEELAGRNDLSSQTLLSVSGGDENTTFYASGFIQNDEGIVENTGYENRSLRLNVQHQFNPRLRVTVNTNLINTEAQRGLFNNDNFLITPYFALPFIPRFLDLRQRPDGTFPENPFAGGSNPLQTFALLKNEENVWRFLGSADVTFDLWEGAGQRLDLIATGGVDWFNQTNDLFFPPELFFEPQDGLPGTSILTEGDNLQYNSSVNLVHSWEPGDWTARTSGGFQYEERQLDIARISSQDLTAGQENLGSGTQIQIAERRELVEDFGFYLQEELLLFNERLTLTGAVRGEQSSSNGDTEELFFYPKASVAYRFPEFGRGIEELKLRVAYGESGNQPLFGQKFISLDATQNIAGEPGLVVNPQVGDPGIEPERTREIEGGVDLTFWNGKARAELTGYQQNITDLLLERRVAPSTGFETQFFNGGELRVRGIEAMLALTPIQTRDLVWFSRVLFFADDSEVIDLPVPAFVLNGAFGPSLGDFQIKEGESATQIVGLVDGELQKVGDVNPDFKMAFANELSWKGWSFYSLWDWQQGGDIVNLTTFISDLAQTTEDFVPDGQRRLEMSSERPTYVEDGTFVKLRELTLAYAFPADWVERLWPAARRLRLSVSGRDLWTITDYSGLDPEVSNFGNQPIARNVDTSPFPPSRSFWFSIDLGF